MPGTGSLRRADVFTRSIRRECGAPDDVVAVLGWAWHELLAGAHEVLGLKRPILVHQGRVNEIPVHVGQHLRDGGEEVVRAEGFS